MFNTIGLDEKKKIFRKAEVVIRSKGCWLLLLHSPW